MAIFKITGTLELEFFNQRLMKTDFTPSDLELYLKHLEYVKGIHLSPGKTIRINNCIIYYHNEDGSFYIRWQDKRLRKEKSDYIDNYA